MAVCPNKVVTISYELRTEPNGSIVDEATKESPFQFLSGHGNLLDKFEEHITGLEIGKTFQFILSPEEGYGEYEQEAVIKMPKSAFVLDGQDASDLIKLGNVIPLQDQNGHPFQGKITVIDDAEVTI
ncbi:MAG TPA: FKBP-type peptidyl-prolyl cis-trans isomerase, partial [Chitinophagales bacterium]